MEFKARLGGEPEDDKAVTLLNRPITWDASGIHYEADLRHVEIGLRDLGLEHDSKGSTIPFEKTSTAE